MTFKVGDRVRSDMYGENGVIKSIFNDYPDNQYGFHIKFSSGPVYQVSSASDLTPYTPVPIGYTGKLKDMDLQEGDVVRHTKGRNDLYTFNNGYVGRVTIENSNDDYTLISRASETWSDWHMSRKDGSYDTHPNREYDVNPLPDTDQVTYRWRDIAGKEPVEEWVDATASTAYYENEFMQVKTIDGKPDWSTIRYVPF